MGDRAPKRTKAGRVKPAKKRKVKATLPPEWEYFTDDEKALLAALADPDATVPMTFREFVEHVRPDYQWYEYNTRAADVLQLVADGYYTRVLVFMPPRLGKSEEFSKLFSAYYLYRFPHRWVALGSYGAELAYDFSRQSRRNYIEALGSEKAGGETEAVKHWETGKGGGEWAVGVRGPATGKGCSLWLIDDPVKDEEEASSEVIQARNIDWFDTVAMTRLAKGGAIVIIQTRFNQKDLSGKVLEREYGDAPEHWHIVCFPAEYTPASTYNWPPTCTIEPDWRALGKPDQYGLQETVCPARLDPKFLAQTKRRNPYVWNALYQQNPTPREGGMFKRGWFEIVPVPPPASQIVASVRRWDIGATEGGGDPTVGLDMLRARNGFYYIRDVVRVQLAAGARDNRIKQVAQLDAAKARTIGKPHAQILPQDPGAAGKDQAAWFRKLLDGMTVRTVTETGDKETRADPLASAAFAPAGEYGRIKLVAGAWNEAFLEEMAAFPYGNHDDQLDAASGAYNYLSSWKPTVIRGTPTMSFYTG